MEAALRRLRAAQGSARWRDSVVESAAVFTEAISGLLASLAPPELTEEQAQARRFASVKVAEMQLYYSEQVRQGQASRNLYAALQPRIDEARAAFEERFLSPGAPERGVQTQGSLKQSRGMPDYLHQEIVRALAQNDETLLGPKYPGPLA